MDDASQYASQQAASQVSPSRPQPGAQRLPARNHDVHDDPLPALSLHFAVPHQQTLTWRLAADSTLRVYGAQVWVTRACSPYDHWLNPGETLRLSRGERIWLSTEAHTPARITLTSAWQPRFATLRRAFGKLTAWPALLAPGRGR
jgi:hypothetical protein